MGEREKGRRKAREGGGRLAGRRWWWWPRGVVGWDGDRGVQLKVFSDIIVDYLDSMQI